MPFTTTIQLDIPEKIQHAASQIIHDAGLTVEQVVHGVLCRIAREHSIPHDLLARPEIDDIERANAIADIRALRKHRKMPAASIAEIIAWRDEGRR